MATIVNARDVLLQATSPRVLTVALPSNQTVDFVQVNGTTKPANNADVTLTAVNGGLAVTGGGITLTAGGALKGGKASYGSGLGFFLGYSSPNYVFDIGGTANYLRWDGSSLSYTGTLSGVGNIDITGAAKFGGAVTSLGNTWAVVANESLGSYGGLIGYTSTGRAAYGYATTSGIGLSGTSATNGTGLAAVSSSGTGAIVQSTSWNALQINGKSVQDNSTYTWNSLSISAPAGSTTTVLHNDGVWRDPVTTARVNSAFGVASGAVVQGIGPNVGSTVLPSAGGISILATVSGVQTSGSGTVLTIQSISDRRLKEDIVDEPLGLEFVLKQRVVSYRMKGDPTLRHGWIYQEVRQHVAGDRDCLAMENPDGFGGVDSTAMAAVLMRAVQQLEQRIPVPLAERARRWFKGVRTWH